MSEAVKRWRATERPGDGAVVEVVDAADHDRIVSSLTEGGMRMQVEQLKQEERLRHADASYYASTSERLRAEVERLRIALEAIAAWPDGGNNYGQDRIKEFAASALEASRCS